ncbi:SH3 domain-containing protein [Leptolyngbya sp. AN03gr2]|uniref:SH3 domain-containing protein n=1 Tax=unclassified Leptolyngbya TaxID=2650499 RepID=UPI003D3240FC
MLKNHFRNQNRLIASLFIVSAAFSVASIASAQSNDDTCRRISASDGLTIQRDASGYSPVVGQLANGARVSIINGGRDGWVPINEPVQGYVSSRYLKQCGSAIPPASCRRISAPSGSYIRQAPSVSSSVIRTLENGRSVNIVNPGANGWVQIELPVQGYVAASNLAYCSPAQQRVLN